MSKKILIHIGTGKTGSTSIQETLVKYSNILVKSGIIYPLILGRSDHLYLIGLYRGYNTMPRGLKSKFPRENKVQLEQVLSKFKIALLDALTQYDNVILSSEILSVMSLDEIGMLKEELFSNGFVEAKIVVYIREPVSYYLSFIQQQLKASSVVTSPKIFKYNFLGIIKNWEHHFPNQVTVRAFERELLVNHSVVADFIHLASEYFAKELWLEDMDRYSNESLSAEAMIILQNYRRLFYPEHDDVFMNDSNRLVDLLQESKSVLSQTKPILKSEAASIIYKNHQNEINVLKKYNITFAKTARTVETEFRYTISSVKDILSGYDEEKIEILLHTLLNMSVKRSIHQ